MVDASYTPDSVVQEIAALAGDHAPEVLAPADEQIEALRRDAESWRRLQDLQATDDEVTFNPDGPGFVNVPR